MPLRRILVALLLLMIVMSIAASLTTPTEDTATVPRRPPPAEADLVRTVTASMPKDRVVNAATGDRIVLEVVADAVDQVEIEGYDLVEPVDPGDARAVRLHRRSGRPLPRDHQLDRKGGRPPRGGRAAA